jgi:hypothetical protein
MSIDYREVLHQALSRYGMLKLQRENLDVEIAKQLEFIRATVNMLSEKESKEFRHQIEEAIKRGKVKEAGLTESIRAILQNSRGQFLTATQVRDRLVNSGFDFSEYLSNPLASVSTTLRRFDSEEIEKTEVRGVAAYKWIRPPNPPRFEGPGFKALQEALSGKK